MWLCINSTCYLDPEQSHDAASASATSATSASPLQGTNLNMAFSVLKHSFCLFAEFKIFEVLHRPHFMVIFFQHVE